MDYVNEVVNTINSLSNEFQTLCKGNNKDEYDKFGWKCVDFVTGIDTKRSYSKEERFALKNALLNLKSLALRLGMFKEYLDTYVEKKTTELSGSKDNKIRINTNQAA